MTGVFVICKPESWTSQDVVSKMRGQLHTKKLGHTGTLDPLATGVLVVLAGKATRLADRISGTKSYDAVFRFGFQSDTLDITGTVEPTFEKVPDFKTIANQAQFFLGEIQQIPPMYSAVKVNGQRLYKLARAGQEIERAPRRAVIESLSIEETSVPSEFRMQTTCSAGTYIRSLIEDLGKHCHCSAVMVSLVRTQAGPYSLDTAKDPREVTIEDMLPVGSALPDTQALVLSSNALTQLYQGKTVEMNRSDNSYFLVDETGAVRALGKVSAGFLRLELNLTEA